MRKIKTITIDDNIERKIRDYQADAIAYTNRNVSFSEIINLLISMSLNDDKKMGNINNYFAGIIERKSR